MITFIHGFENVFYKIVAILSWPQYVKVKKAGSNCHNSTKQLLLVHVIEFLPHTLDLLPADSRVATARAPSWRWKLHLTTRIIRTTTQRFNGNEYYIIGADWLPISWQHVGGLRWESFRTCWGAVSTEINPVQPREMPIHAACWRLVKRHGWLASGRFSQSVSVPDQDTR